MDQPARKVNKRLNEQALTSYNTNNLLVRSRFYTQSISEQVVIALNVLLQIQLNTSQVGGTVALWLVRLTLDRVVGALAEVTIL